MRIESIHIRGFGCLVDRHYDFPADRAALILADNESGKSTLAAAIVAGLCGFPAQRRTKGSLTIRDAYEPWHGDAYGVEMDITAESRMFHIERDFTRDSFVVRDSETGKDITAQFDRDLAAHFLRLPREDFQRIGCISGKESPSFGPAPNIQARLSALIEGSEDDTGAEIAIGALEGARCTLDAGGPLKPETAARRLAAAIEQKRQALRDLETEMDTASEEARRLEESKACQAELNSALARLDEEHRAARLAEEQASAAQVANLKLELSTGQAKARLGVISQQRRAGRQLGASVLIAGVALSAISFGLWMLEMLPTNASLAVVLIGIVVAAAGAVKATRAEAAHADERADLEAQIAQVLAQNGQNGPKLAEIGRSSAEIDDDRRQIRGELDQVQTEINRLEKCVGATVDRYRRDYSGLRQQLRGLEDEIEKVERFAEAVDVAKGALREVAEESRRRWAAALNRTASSILPHLNPDYDDLRFDESLAFTIRHTREGRVLEKAEIDARLSTGAKDQIYLAVRLACCDELSGAGESIPVLLDDPLMAADDSRFASGLRYLVETYAKRHQVIILSCARGRHAQLASEPWFAVEAL